MKITIKPVTADSPFLPQVEALNESAFPANERRPLLPLLRDSTGHGEAVAFYDGGLFCGYACLLTNGDISHIIYFAVEESLRGKGYGTAALSAMVQWKTGKRVIADIELAEERHPQYAQRHRRKQFYLHCGFAETGIVYRWRGESFEILSAGGAVSSGEFRDFWEQVYTDNPALGSY